MTDLLSFSASRCFADHTLSIRGLFFAIQKKKKKKGYKTGSI